jgi:hypothetical protein
VALRQSLTASALWLGRSSPHAPRLRGAWHHLLPGAITVAATVLAAAALGRHCFPLPPSQWRNQGGVGRGHGPPPYHTEKTLNPLYYMHALERI